jgi:hypothetical protein
MKAQPSCLAKASPSSLVTFLKICEIEVDILSTFLKLNLFCFLQ